VSGHMNTEARVAAIVDEHIRHKTNTTSLASWAPSARARVLMTNPSMPITSPRRPRVLRWHIAGLPGLRLNVQRRHVALDAVAMEVIVRGVHLGPWVANRKKPLIAPFAP
jgi:hypothetical protein